MDPFQAGRTLGDAIFGDTGDVYAEAHTKASRARDAMHKARSSQAQALVDEHMASERQKVNADLMRRYQQGDPEAAAVLGAATLGSAQTMNLRNLGNLETPGFIDANTQAREAILGETPDAAKYNRAQAFIAGKPYQPVVHEGGGFRADGVTLGELDVVPDPLTAERINATQAQAAATQQRAAASVEASRARANLLGRTDPNRPRGGSRPKEGKRIRIKL